LSKIEIEQSSQKMVSTDLGVGIRQLRRIEIQALTDLAEILEKHCIPAPPSSPELGDEISPAAIPEPAPHPLAAAAELSRFKDGRAAESFDIRGLIQSVLNTVQPLQRDMRVTIRLDLPDAAITVSGDQTTLRQALINILTAEIHLAAGGGIQISAAALGNGILVGISIERTKKETLELADTIQMARELVGISDGQLEVQDGMPAGRVYRFRLNPAFASAPMVMVVDDNQDALRLIQHYCLASNHRFTGSPDPHHALELAEKIQPALILIDVMMPGLDGWELLGRFREHPTLGHVPVIVSTILPQEKFALSLGAAGFLRKPFSQDEFVSVLKQALKPGREWR